MAKETKEKRIKAALGREDGGKKKTHVHGMHIRRATGGGFIARHEMADEDGNPPNGGMGGGAAPEHILPDMASAQGHLDEHMGDQPAAGEAAPPPDAGAPTEA